MASPRCPVPLIKGDEVLDVGRYQCAASRCGRRKHLLVRQGSHRAVLYRGHDIVAARSELSCDRAAQHLIKEKRGCHELAGEQIALASPHGLGSCLRAVSCADLGLDLGGGGGPVTPVSSTTSESTSSSSSSGSAKRADLTARTTSQTSGPAASAARRPVGPSRNAIPGCSVKRRPSSTSRFAAADKDNPGCDEVKEARRAATSVPKRPGVGDLRSITYSVVDGA